MRQKQVSESPSSPVSFRRWGFTLVELMVVIVILGLLAGLVAVNVVGRITQAKINTARAQIKTFEDAVLQYKMDTGQYPPNDYGLLALIEPPPGVTGWNKDGYLHTTEIPTDPWGNAYNYWYPSEWPGMKFDIWSWGADGQEGGEDENADIYNGEVERVGEYGENTP